MRMISLITGFTTVILIKISLIRICEVNFSPYNPFRQFKGSTMVEQELVNWKDFIDAMLRG
ncbi:protein YpfM [Ewingella sp. AOP9-I1-14]